MMKLLAFDTSTQTVGIALYVNQQFCLVEAEGGASTSAILLPQIGELLAQHNVKLQELDAIAFGAGPGAFTGLRAAAATAQGLALGANLPVIPVITLLAGAQQYLLQHQDALNGQAEIDILVQLDARMDEWYWAHYQWERDGWHVLQEPILSSPESLKSYQEQAKPTRSIIITDAQMLGMVELAKQAWQKGETVVPQEALPVYLRNKVALTTVERMALHAQKMNIRE